MHSIAAMRRRTEHAVFPTVHDERGASVEFDYIEVRTSRGGELEQSTACSSLSNASRIVNVTWKLAQVATGTCRNAKRAVGEPNERGMSATSRNEVRSSA